jgi:hypothetical protein
MSTTMIQKLKSQVPQWLWRPARWSLTAALMAALVFLFGQGTAFAQEAEAVQKHADIVWTIVAAALVFFMQAGFAMVEAGFTRAKNAANIMMKNLMDFCMGCCAFWFIGFWPHVRQKCWLLRHRLVCFWLAAGLRGRRLAFHLFCFPDGVCRHCRHHCFRSHGGAHQVRGLPHLLCRHLWADLPHLGELGLEWPVRRLQRRHQGLVGKPGLH